MGYLSDYANNVSQILQQQGNAQAAARLQSGQAWGNAFQQIGQTIGQIPGQIQQAKLATQQEEENKLKLDALRKSAQMGELMGQAYKSSLVNGKLDPSALSSNLAKLGIDPAPYIKPLMEANKLAVETRTAKETADLDYFGNLAAKVKAFAPEHRATAFFTALQAAKAEGHDTQGIAEQIFGGMPIDKVLDGALQASQKQRELMDKERGTKTSADRLAAELPGIMATGQINQNVAQNMQGGLTQAQAEQLAQSAASLAETKRHNTVDERLSAQRVGLELERLKNAGQLTPNAALEATMSLKKSYDKETSANATVQQQLANMRSALEQAKKGNLNAGSQGVLVTFQKILDPSSVVRESEYARSGEGLGLMTRLQGAAEKLAKGGAGVPVKDLEDFVKMAEDFAANQQKYAAQQGDQITNIAKRYGLKPEDIVRAPINQPVQPPPGWVIK